MVREKVISLKARLATFSLAQILHTCVSAVQQTFTDISLDLRYVCIRYGVDLLSVVVKSR